MNFNRSAFTLVEILVTLIISSMILFIGTLSMKQMISILSKQTSTLPNDALNYIRLRKIIGSNFSYIIYSKKPFSNQMYDYQFYFEGSEDSIRFISISPLFASEPSIIELKIQNNSLIYSESLLYSSTTDYLHPTPSISDKTYTLFEKIEDASFKYDINNSIISTLSGVIPEQIKLTFSQNNTPIEYTFNLNSRYPQNIKNIRKSIETF